MQYKSSKIQWLALLQGWSMLLVVVGHAALDSGNCDQNSLIAASIQSVIYSFHMQLFMFISGWLFFHTCINRPKAYGDIIKSKLSRLGIPFIVFTILTTFVKVLMSTHIKRPVDTTELINTFVFFKSNPLLEMWFVIALFVLMSLYPLYKILLTNRCGEILGIILMFILFLFFPNIENYFQLKRVAQMGLFFYFGILACKYNWANIFKRKYILFLSLLIFIYFQFFHFPLSSVLSIIVSSSGIMFSISLCMNVADKHPNLFYSFRDYTYQIFLLGIFFQIACKIIYLHLNVELIYWPIYMLSIGLAIYIPTIISKVILRINNSILKKCFGL